MQEHRDLPPQLLFADRLKLSLIIASFGGSKPLKTEFASVHPVIANDTEKPTPPERWGPKPEITHTFREPQKLPNRALSAIFHLAVLASVPIFIVLVSLHSLIKINVAWNCICRSLVPWHSHGKCPYGPCRLFRVITPLGIPILQILG